MKQIRFFLDQYYLFSNYSALPIIYNGVKYPTSEHAYQTNKFSNNIKISTLIKNAQSPSEAKRLSIVYKKEQREDWDNVKLSVMTEIIYEKARQHEEIRRKLLETNDAEIIENSMLDYFWGCGKNDSGQNNMGKLWMKIREEIVNKTFV